jgi:hypothetical protein
MLRFRRISTLLASIALLAAVQMTAPSSARAFHCNNKVCSPTGGGGGLDLCYAQTNGPGKTHCIQSGETCAWDMCSPE